MGFAEDYISKVGRQSHDLMKGILYELLKSRYEGLYDEGFANYLAAAVGNYLFCEEASNAEGRSFAEENRALIEQMAKELSKEDALCLALTCAVYNACYCKYVESGGKVGLLFHPFLAYVRALQEVLKGKEPQTFLDSFSRKAGSENVIPLLNLCQLGLYRLLPYLPDSKLMMDEVISFGESV